MPDLAWPTENDKTIKEIPLKQTVEIPTPLQGDLYYFLIKIFDFNQEGIA
jgi:hypothetical protein